MVQTIITITGASGSGKTTLEKHLESFLGYKRAVSFTTRKPREGEVDGQDYHFVTPHKAVELISGGKAIEHVEVADNFYGVLVDEISSSDVPVVVVVEPKGLLQVYNYCQTHEMNHVCIVLENETSVLVERFIGRYKSKGVSPDEIGYLNQRLANIINVESSWADAIEAAICQPDVRGKYDPENQGRILKQIEDSVAILSGYTREGD